MKTLMIAKLLGSELMSRTTARDFYQSVRADYGIDMIEIDFAGVNFVSRSFMDEFYNSFLKPGSQPFALCTNMSEDITAMLQAVKATQNKKKEAEEFNVIRPSKLVDLDRAFAALYV